MGKGKVSLVILSGTMQRLIRMRGIMEYETGKRHFLDDVLNKLVDEYKLHHRMDDINGNSNGEIAKIQISR